MTEQSDAIEAEPKKNPYLTQAEIDETMARLRRESAEG